MHWWVIIVIIIAGTAILSLAALAFLCRVNAQVHEAIGRMGRFHPGDLGF